jgi:hypothetical protein
VTFSGPQAAVAAAGDVWANADTVRSMARTIILMAFLPLRLFDKL